MARYTYEDVIINPKDPRVEIGKEYCFGDIPEHLINNANSDNNFWARLEKVSVSEGFNFKKEGGGGGWHSCIIRKKEPSYEERQAEWVKANNIKDGDKVRVIRKAKTNENGWGDVWDCEYMDPSVNKVLEVVETKGIAGISLDCGRVNCCFPYFVLEKVEEPEFKVGDFVRTEYESIGVITEIIAHDFVVVRTNNLSYFNLSKSRLEHIKAHLKPFDLEDKDTRDKIRGCWIRKKDNSEIKLIWGLWELDGKWMIDEGTNPQELLNDWVFEDGSPCGIVVEDEQ